MLDDYRPLVVNGMHLIALYAVAYISAPLTPSNFVEYVVLGVASLWLLYAMYLMQKDKRRPSSMFFAAIALIPWAFYGELWYINANKDGIAPEVFEQNLTHAVFIYQSFKYLMLACAIGAAFKGLFIAMREFGNSR